MPRNKYPEVTVKKILDVSLALFVEKGFEQTTVLDIVAELEGMTRGAFYHHFKNKEEVLKSLLERTLTERDCMEEIVNDISLSGLQKLRAVMMQSMQANVSTNENTTVLGLYVGLMKNPRFFLEKFKNDLLTAQEFEPLIAEGMADGSIRQGNPKLLSELLMLLINTWLFPRLFPSDSMEEMWQKGEMIKDMLDGLGFPIIDEEMGQLYESVVTQVK